MMDLNEKLVKALEEVYRLNTVIDFNDKLVADLRIKNMRLKAIIAGIIVGYIIWLISIKCWL